MITRMMAGLLIFMAAVLMLMAVLSQWDYDSRVVVAAVALVFAAMAIVVEIFADIWR